MSRQRTPGEIRAYFSGALNTTAAFRAGLSSLGLTARVHRELGKSVDELEARIRRKMDEALFQVRCGVCGELLEQDRTSAIIKYVHTPGSACDAWMCNCGEWVTQRHWKTNEDGTMRHDPAGVDHEVDPEANKRANGEAYYPPPPGYRAPATCALNTCRQPIRYTAVTGGQKWVHDSEPTEPHEVVMRTAGWWDVSAGRTRYSIYSRGMEAELEARIL